MRAEGRVALTPELELEDGHRSGTIISFQVAYAHNVTARIVLINNWLLYLPCRDMSSSIEFQKDALGYSLTVSTMTVYNAILWESLLVNSGSPQFVLTVLGPNVLTTEIHRLWVGRIRKCSGEAHWNNLKINYSVSILSQCTLGQANCQSGPSWRRAVRTYRVKLITWASPVASPHDDESSYRKRCFDFRKVCHKSWHTF